MGFMFCPNCGMLKSNCICGYFNKTDKNKDYKIDKEVKADSPQKVFIPNRKYSNRLKSNKEKIIPKIIPPQSSNFQEKILSEILDSVKEGYKFIVLEANHKNSDTVVQLANNFESSIILTANEKSQMRYNRKYQLRKNFNIHLTNQIKFLDDFENIEKSNILIIDDAHRLDENIINLFSYTIDLSNYDKLIKMNATPSRSCLIYGLPGTGKTHLAKWIAKQLGLPIVLAKLDGIVSSFLGTSSRNIGNLFAFANRYKCILLLDEFDAIAKLRNDPQEVGEVKRIVNTLLQCLDSRDEIGFTIGVTNHEQLLDPAIWRRFDVQIEIPKPSPSIIPLLLKNFISPLKYNEAEISFLSWCIQDCSGADIQKLSNWLKRMSIIDEYKNECLYHLMQRYTLLNTGRISDKVKEIITKAPDDIYASLKASSPELKQKDIAEIFNMTPSSFCKMIQKNNKE